MNGRVDRCRERIRSRRIIWGIIVGLALGSGAASPIRAGEPKVYLADLEAFFRTMDEKYPFFAEKGIEKEWAKAKRELAQRCSRCSDDRSFLEIVVEAMRCLRDGHMGFTEVRPKVDPPPPEFYPGIALLPAGRNGVVVMSTEPNLAATLPPGTLVTKIDGKPARKVLDRMGALSWSEGGFFSSPQRARFFAYRLPLTGERGDTHTLHYVDGRKQKKLDLVCNREVKGWDHNYNLPAGLEQAGKSLHYGRLEGDVAYVYLRRMDEGIESGLRQAIASLAGVQGWIIDLRGNTGGGYDDGLQSLLAQLKKPVVGIIDAGCVSAGETFARDLVRRCDARLIGERSAGSSSSKEVFEFPSGIAKIRYSVRSRGGLDGEPIEFRGIVPHEELEADPKDVATGKNTEIERARAIILGAK
ncbi:MAG: hypothetical protein KDC38_08085 [Planctomycetes bacterium]|nr:hypothetical protein [Planctomycetota bacterium]